VRDIAIVDTSARGLYQLLVLYGTFLLIYTFEIKNK